MSRTQIYLIDALYFIITIIISLAFFRDGRIDYLINPVLTTVFYLGVILLERYSSFQTHLYIKILIILILTSHNLIGEYYDAYNQNNYFDKILHFTGTFSFTLFAYTLVIHFLTIRSSHPFIFTVIFITILGMCFGAIFEIGEFAFDHFFDQNNQRSNIDTNTDMLLNLFGAFVAGLYMGKKQPLHKIK